MQGDFSRLTFDKKKNYCSVLKQQGRVSLDSDWNELIEIIAHQLETRTFDTIGACGRPFHDNGYGISQLDGQEDLIISTGRLYVDGLLCELHPGAKIPVKFPKNTTDKVQVDELKIDGIELLKDEWVVIFSEKNSKGITAKITQVDTTSKILTLDENISSLHQDTSPHLRRKILYSQQPDYPNSPDWNPKAEQICLVYLDVWKRHITAIEDPDLREVALGGPDTDTRIQTIAQVKILPDVQECHKKTAPSGGRLTTQTKAESKPDDPCLLAESGGYRGLENRLYRVEIHDGGELGTATFKWSRDNGSVAYEISEFIPDGSAPPKYNKIRLKQVGRDDVLKVKENDWLEISGDQTELGGNSGTLVKVVKVDETERILTLSEDVADHKVERHPKARRWDTGPYTKALHTIKDSNSIELEDGIQVIFSGNNFKTGDYWTFYARTATGKVEELKEEPPQGIKHHYCPLALVKWKDDKPAEIKDCRKVFPPLTELTGLFYVSGDGQEVMPDLLQTGKFLPLPQLLKVGVANGQWPVAGAIVRFKVIEGKGQLRVNATTTVKKSELTVTTGVDGLASCYWELDSEKPSQQVEATLLDAAGKSVHLPVYFNANLSVASQVAYNPKNCPNLKNAATVQTAIDQLCNFVSKEEPGIKIEEVLLNNNNQPLYNDTEVAVNDLAEGVRVICDQEISPDTVEGKPTCFVTLDMPYPLNYLDIRMWGNSVIGFQPLILAADVKDSENSIIWTPALDTATWLRKNLFPVIRERGIDRLLAHLTLKGNFIWAADHPELLYLDGEAFGVRNSGRTNIDLHMPSGDGRRGGDFEMWFWLVRDLS